MAACQLDCREYSSDYVAAEDAAKAAKRGIWAGAFDVPADWRKERKVLARLMLCLAMKAFNGRCECPLRAMAAPAVVQGVTPHADSRCRR